MTNVMKAEDEGTWATSWTLVARLKNVDDQDAWRQLYDLYSRLVFGVALKAGLQPAEAEEVLQETLASLSRHIQEFRADPARGSFRAWLMQMARWRIRDQFAKRLPTAAPASSEEESAATPLLDRVPEQPVNLERLCDAEWRERLREQAFRQLQLEVTAEQYQIFYLLMVEEKSAAQVARMLGRTQPQIYVIKHRVGRALKKIVRRLEAKLG
jgi:RNA polymerase sigma-70 factor (ECF subfamily)